MAARTRLPDWQPSQAKQGRSPFPQRRQTGKTTPRKQALAPREDWALPTISGKSDVGQDNGFPIHAPGRLTVRDRVLNNDLADDFARIPHPPGIISSGQPFDVVA